MNDFIQLKPQSNVYEAETMVEGWHSFSFFFFFEYSVRVIVGLFGIFLCRNEFSLLTMQWFHVCRDNRRIFL